MVESNWRNTYFLLIPLYIDFLGVGKFVTNWNIGEWSGFLGSYLGGGIGAFITLGGIWWQLNENKNQFQESLGEQKRQFDFQIKQEKIKMQLGSLKIIEYYFTILSSKLKDTILSPDGEEVKFYRKLFYGNLFIDSELISDNKDYFIISKKNIEILNNNINNISSLDNYLDTFKIINALEHIENIVFASTSENNFSKIIDEIVTNLNLDNSQITFILKTKLTLNYFKNRNSIPIRL